MVSTVTTDILTLTPEGPVLELIESEFPNQPPVRMDAGALPNPFKGINPVISILARYDLHINIRLPDGLQCFKPIFCCSC